MPKISTKEQMLRGEHMSKPIKFDVMYNQRNKFYVIFEKEYEDKIVHLSEEERDKLDIEFQAKTKQYNAEKQWLVTSSSENECIQKYITAMKVLFNLSIRQRNVIIVTSQEIKDHSTQADRLYNKEHLLIGCSIGLCYAVESNAGDKKVYSIYKEYTAFGETRTDRKELYFGRTNPTVVDDTPENRKALEALYEAMKTLTKKIGEITFNGEALLQFIESKTKLLTLNQEDESRIQES
jgi:hypothetical protein